jgi:7-cyano-7-deazaguanine synthase
VCDVGAAGGPGYAARSERRPGHELGVVLVSGGLDSCVCVADTVRTADLALLHVRYGQRTQDRERRSFNDIADHYGVPDARRLVADCEHLARIGGSSLLDRTRSVETGLPDQLKSGRSVPSTYVPFRNANILALGVGWAEVLGARSITIGVVQEDSSGYPDCSAAFIEAFQQVVDLGTRPETTVTIRAPLIGLDKAAIVRRGLELGAPLHLTWSCYVNEDRACGRCESCRLRLRGFAAAGAVDPVAYV